MRPYAALLAVLIAALPAAAHKGEGTFTDFGARGAHHRFELDFGPVDLERAGSREFRFSDLPAEELVFGLRLTAPGGGKLGALPSATVRIALANENGETVFDMTDEVANLVRSETAKEWFLYQRGKVPLPGSAKPGAQRLSIGPDGGWGTYALPRRNGSYRLTFETVKADSHLTKFGVRLIGVGGGWK